MHTKTTTILYLAGLSLLSTMAVGQDRATNLELDAYWTELSRTIMEGDFDGLKSLYHPDALNYAWQGDSYTMALMSGSLDSQAEFHAGTEDGVRIIELGFRFASRIHSEQAAHDVGIARFFVIENGREPTTQYAHVENYLVKKDRWLSIVENVRFDAEVSEWDALQ